MSAPRHRLAAAILVVVALLGAAALATRHAAPGPASSEDRSSPQPPTALDDADGVEVAEGVVAEGVASAVCSPAEGLIRTFHTATVPSRTA